LKCKFCQQYRKEFNSALKSETFDWEYWESNEDAIRDSESPSNIELREQASALIKTDPEAALVLYERAYANGSISAPRQIGWHCETGGTLEQNPIKAKEYYLTGWKRGSQLSGLEFARCSYRDNEYEQALAALEDLTSEGFVPAHYYIANYTAHHRDKDATDGAVLPHLQTAAEGGHPLAMFWLGRIMCRGKLGLKNVPAGINMYWPLVMRIHKKM